MSVWDLRRWRWVVVLTSATLFIVSLTQTAFVIDVSYNREHVEPMDHSGAELLQSTGNPQPKLMGAMARVRARGDDLVAIPVVLVARVNQGRQVAT
jgi:hypothetical protein